MAKRVIVTPELVEKMAQLYKEKGTYKAVSEALGGSPSPTTVSRYLKDYNFKVVRDESKIPDPVLPPFNYDIFVEKESWNDFLVLSSEEKAEIELLWKEMEQ